MDEKQRQLLAANAFMRHNGISVTEITSEHAVAVLHVAPESLNPYGCLHGGAYFTMADAASGALARYDGRSYVTISSSFNFIRPVSSGQVTAMANLRHRGRTTCLTSVSVTDEAGNLLACGDFTFFCVPAPALSSARLEGQE